MAFPPGITVVRATLRKGEGKGDVLPVTLYPARWRTSAKKHGVALTTSSPSGAAPRRAMRGGAHAMPAPHGALPRRPLAIRANPRPMRVSGHSLDHNGEGFAL